MLAVAERGPAAVWVMLLRRGWRRQRGHHHQRQREVLRYLLSARELRLDEWRAEADDDAAVGRAAAQHLRRKPTCSSTTSMSSMLWPTAAAPHESTRSSADRRNVVRLHTAGTRTSVTST